MSSTCTRVTPRQATSAVAYVGEEPEDDDPLLGFAPYLHVQPRSNAITPERQQRFIATLAATGEAREQEIARDESEFVAAAGFSGVAPADSGTNERAENQAGALPVSRGQARLTP